MNTGQQYKTVTTNWSSLADILSMWAQDGWAPYTFLPIGAEYIKDEDTNLGVIFTRRDPEAPDPLDLLLGEYESDSNDEEEV